MNSMLQQSIKQMEIFSVSNIDSLNHLKHSENCIDDFEKVRIR